MSLLSKRDIWELIELEQTFSRDDSNGKALLHQIQPSSFDVTVGRIYIPPEPNDEEAAVVVERDDFYTLKPGAMAIVLSREHVRLNSDSGGFVFPKNGDFALKGLLFTNFGHIDPGFSGHLRFTVINMGRGSVTLRNGARIAGITLFRLTSPTDKYAPQHASSCETNARVLSRDFLDVERRAAITAKTILKNELEAHDKKTTRLTIYQIVIALIIAAIGLGWTTISFYEKFAAMSVEIGKLQIQLEALKQGHQSSLGQTK